MPMQSNAELLAALDKDVGSTRALDLQKMVFAWDVYGAGFDGYDVVNAFFTEGHADLLGRCGIDWIFLKEQLAKQSKGALQRAYQEYVANEFKIDDLSSSQHYVALRRLRDNCPEWQDRPLQSWPFSKIEAALQPATHDGTFYVRRWTTIVDVRELLLDAAVAVVRVHAKVTFEEALKAVALECDPTINTDDPEALVDAILNVTVRWRARADVAYTSAGRPLVGLTAAQEADVDLVSSTRRRAGQTVRSTWRALTSMPMGSPEWARDATLANGTPADDLEDSDVLPARDVEAVVHMINKRATTGVDVVGPTPLYLSVGSPPLPGDDTTLGEKVDGMIRELQRMKGSPCPPQQLLYAIAADTEKSGRLARALLHATSSGLRSSMAADTTPWTRKWVSALSEVLRPFYIYLKFADAEYNLYSNVTLGATPLSEVPRAPAMPRQWVEGHVLTRHDELVVARHPEGDCAAEATAFATGKPHVGEAVAAARALKEKEGMRLHDVHEAVQPHGYELRTELRGHEEAGALTFVRVCTSLRSGIHLLQTTAS